MARTTHEDDEGDAAAGSGDDGGIDDRDIDDGDGGFAGDVDMDVDVLFDEGDLVVVDKPAGLATLPGTGVQDEETLWGAMRAGFDVEPGFSGPSFLGRLDRPTSGIIVAAMSRTALRAIEPAWSAGEIHKDYLVIVHGKTPPQGRIDVRLAARRPRLKGTGTIEDALTTYVRVAASARASMIVARIHTGRTHQIRRHLKAIGHPLIGDSRYGHPVRDQAMPDKPPGLMLHAWRISHDGSAPILPTVLEAPAPARIVALASTLGLDLGALARVAFPES